MQTNELDPVIGPFFFRDKWSIQKTQCTLVKKADFLPLIIAQ